jgi:(1->4)-alpha-D-glucan 1-alpha-D-glucosylmutase
MLKLTVPGVPDFYQGSEFWDLSLVDPDNRRKVDFARHIAALQTTEQPDAMAAHWRDGRVKQAMIRRVLALRRNMPELFAHGSYRPLDVSGDLATHVVAFVRSHADRHCVSVVPRVTGRLLSDAGSIVIPKDAWQNTGLLLPEDLVDRSVRDVITDARMPRLDCRVPLGNILATFPVALLATE